MSRGTCTGDEHPDTLARAGEHAGGTFAGRKVVVFGEVLVDMYPWHERGDAGDVGMDEAGMGDSGMDDAGMGDRGIGAEAGDRGMAGPGASDAPRISPPPFRYAGMLGGAPANVAIHLADMGIPVSLVASFADDPPGQALRGILQRWGVDLGYSVMHERTRTPLALVDELPGGERTFRLYLQGSAAERVAPPMDDALVLRRADWFHFGSLLLAFPAMQKVALHLLQAARVHGVATSYDVNVRADVWDDSPVDPGVIVDAMRYVDVLKLSDEDFRWLAQKLPGLHEPDDLFRWGCRVIAYTEGARGATLMTRGERATFPAPAVKVVDAAGAGDAFMAGIISALLGAGNARPAELLRDIDKSLLHDAGRIATERAAAVLVRRGASPAEPRRPAPRDKLAGGTPRPGP